jgi:hypothetical protein
MFSFFRHLHFRCFIVKQAANIAASGVDLMKFRITCLFTLILGSLVFFGCDSGAGSQSTAPSVVELSNDFTVLKNRELTADRMAFHGVTLGSPEPTALALPHAQKFEKKDFDEIECDDLHAAFVARHGIVTEICILDPVLEDKLNIHQLDDVQMQLGKADRVYVDPGDPASGGESGRYGYFDRHIEVYICPGAKPDGRFIQISVTLLQ